MYVECQYAKVIMMNVIMLTVSMLNVIMMNVSMMNVSMLNVSMLNVNMLNVNMLNAMTPSKGFHSINAVPCQVERRILRIITQKCKTHIIKF